MATTKKTAKKVEKADKYFQFYTEPSIANYCINILSKNLEIMNYHNFKFLEPSAGTGNFIDAVEQNYPNHEIVSIDIDPYDDRVRKMDYLKSSIRKLHLKKKDQVIVVGNPPFGKKSTLAIQFFNKSCEYADIIAFILPLQFEKWSVQSKLNKDMKLIHSERLDPKSFIFKDKEVSIRCCFQIWVKNNLSEKDLRIKKAPITKHKDFEMYQYNYTEEAKKFFDKQKYGWDFAVPRQGYYDYNQKIYNQEDLSYKIQWIFFKAKNEQILNNLRQIDFCKLSLKNTTTPGFGKADVIEEYVRMFGDDSDVS